MCLSTLMSAGGRGIAPLLKLFSHVFPFVVQVNHMRGPVSPRWARRALRQMDRMETRTTSEASGPSVPVPPPHRCYGAHVNDTCAEHLSLFPPFSSTLALLVLVAVLVGIVLVSLATFHFHKRKLRNRKIQRAQEEYERDSRSPARAGASGEPSRPCVIVRPVKCDGKEPRDGARSGAVVSGVARGHQEPQQTVDVDC